MIGMLGKTTKMMTFPSLRQGSIQMIPGATAIEIVRTVSSQSNEGVVGTKVGITKQSGHPLTAIRQILATGTEAAIGNTRSSQRSPPDNSSGNKMLWPVIQVQLCGQASFLTFQAALGWLLQLNLFTAS
jgi:hypothetical protein